MAGWINAGNRLPPGSLHWLPDQLDKRVDLEATKGKPKWIEAIFDGRSVQAGNGQAAEKFEKKSVRQVKRRENLSRRIERALLVTAE